MDYQVKKLANGITIITHKMLAVKSVAINVMVGVGSRYEEENEHGISHFLEHMAFQGTTNRSARQIAEEFDNIGGQFNAYTSAEQTVYFAKILRENTPIALEILSDILLNSKYDEQDINKEKLVINQEIAQTQDSPDTLTYEKNMEQAFLGQSLGRPITGTFESISKFTSQDFFNYTKKHYGGENIIISIAGDISHHECQKWCEEFFSSFQNLKRTPATLAKYIGGSSVTHKDLEQATIFISFPSPSYDRIQDYYKTLLLSLIFGEGISSRLFQEIREKRSLAYSIGSFATSYHDIGLFTIAGGIAPESLDEFLKATNGEIGKIIDNISDMELTRAKSQIRSSLLMSQERTSAKSYELGQYYAILGKIINIDEISDDINSLTKKDILGIAAEILMAKPTITAVGPNLNQDIIPIPILK